MVLVTLLLMLLTAGASGWVYFHGTRSVREKAKAEGLYNYDRTRPSANPLTVDPAGIDPDQKIPRLLRQVDDWALKVTLATGAGGTGVMLVVVMGFVWWRKVCIARMSESG